MRRISEIAERISENLKRISEILRRISEILRRISETRGKSLPKRALLSPVDCQHIEFKVLAFGDGKFGGMVGGLHALFEYTHAFT